MDNTLQEKKLIRKYSKFGLISVLIGISNIFILIYFFSLFADWIIKNPEIIKNPSIINGMPISDTIMIQIYFYLIVQLSGFFAGILGLIEKNKKRTLPLIGILLNGLFLSFTTFKLF